MLHINKFKVLILFFFPFFLIATDFKEEIQYIKQLRHQVWLDFVSVIYNEDKAKIKDVELVSDEGEVVYISQDFAYKLLSINSYGRLKRIDDAYRGHHPVVRLGQTFVKSDVVLPHLDPMMEAAVFFFHSLLWKEGVVPSRFVFLKNVKIRQFAENQVWNEFIIKSLIQEDEENLIKHNPQYDKFITENKQSYLIQISTAIEGVRGKDFIDNVEQGIQSFSQVNLSNYQKHFLTSLFIVPGDHKSENFIVNNNNDLIFIDNDCVFHHTKLLTNINQQYEKVQPFAGCKSILFLLKPLMKETFHESIVNRFRDLTIDGFLKIWIGLLEELNEHLKRIVSSDDLEKKYSKNYLPFCFEANTIFSLKEKLLFIKNDFLEKGKIESCNDLFYKIYPDLAKYYDYMLMTHKTYLKTLQKIYSSEIPYAEGRNKDVKLSIDAIKGKWIFNILENYKNRRNQDMNKSLLEITNGTISIEPEIIKNDLHDILLKNCDDLLFRALISKDIIEFFKDNNMSTLMGNIYPYNGIQRLFNLKIDNQYLIDEIEKFTLQKNIYEDFVDCFLKNQRQPSEGMKKILQLLNKKNF